MTPKSRPATILAAASAVSMACATQHMALAPGLASHARPLHVAAVPGPGPERLGFGPFQIHAIEEEPVSTVTRADLVTRRVRYSYRLRDETGREWQAICESNRRAGRQSGAVALHCTIRDAGGMAWNLELSGSATGSRLTFGEVKGPTRLHIQSNHGLSVLGEPPADRAGFDISLDERPVAAVQTRGVDQIWIREGLRADLRSVIAVSAAGLVLFDHLARS